MYYILMHVSIYKYMHECMYMYIYTLADPDLPEGGHISDKILKLHPKIFHFPSLAQKFHI